MFHVQYAHAGANSVFRNVASFFPSLEESAAEIVNSNLSLRSDAGEIDPIKELARSRHYELEAAARVRVRYRVAIYLYDLARSFHG